MLQGEVNTKSVYISVNNNTNFFLQKFRFLSIYTICPFNVSESYQKYKNGAVRISRRSLKGGGGGGGGCVLEQEGICWRITEVFCEPHSLKFFLHNPANHCNGDYKSIIYSSRILCLSSCLSSCHIPVIFLSYSCRPVIVAERWVILYVIVIKLTE